MSTHLTALGALAVTTKRFVSLLVDRLPTQTARVSLSHRVVKVLPLTLVAMRV